MYKLNLGCSLGCFDTVIHEDKTYDILPLFDTFKQNVKALKENGFNSIELCPMAGWNYEEEQKYFPLVTKFLDVIKEEGITLNSVHLPFALSFWNFASLDDNKRKFSVEHAKWAMKFFEKVNLKYFVIHPGLRPKTVEERLPMLDQLVKSMKDICESTPVTICIENMTSVGLLNQTSEAKYVLERVPKLMMVIDVNHPFIETPEDYILKIGDRVKALHVSDRDNERERHCMPGDGVINFNNVIGALEKIGYKGEFTYEVSIDKNQTPFKIRTNFDTLFENYNNSKK